MGAQASMLYQIPNPPSYDKSLDDLQWVSNFGMEIPIIYREYKDKEGNKYNTNYKIFIHTSINKQTKYN